MTSPLGSLPAWISLDIVGQLITFDSSNIADKGSYTFQLNASTIGTGSANTFSTFTIDLIDPCTIGTIDLVDESYSNTKTFSCGMISHK